MSDSPPPMPSRSTRSSLTPEERLLLIEERLVTGNIAFSDLKTRIAVCETKIEPPRAPKVPIWPYVMGIFTIASAVGGWLIAIGRYPDRTEVERSAATVESKVERLEERNRDFALQLTRLQTQLEERGAVEDLLQKLTGSGGKKK